MEIDLFCRSPSPLFPPGYDCDNGSLSPTFTETHEALYTSIQEWTAGGHNGSIHPSTAWQPNNNHSNNMQPNHEQPNNTQPIEHVCQSTSPAVGMNHVDQHQQPAQTLVSVRPLETINASKKSRRKPHKAPPKQHHEEPPKELPKEIPKEIPKELPKEIPKELPKEPVFVGHSETMKNFLWTSVQNNHAKECSKTSSSINDPEEVTHPICLVGDGVGGRMPRVKAVKNLKGSKNMIFIFPEKMMVDFSRFNGGFVFTDAYGLRVDGCGAMLCTGHEYADAEKVSRRSYVTHQFACVMYFENAEECLVRNIGVVGQPDTNATIGVKSSNGIRWDRCTFATPIQIVNSGHSGVDGPPNRGEVTFTSST
jgi:hypothetical protein